MRIAGAVLACAFLLAGLCAAAEFRSEEAKKALADYAAAVKAAKLKYGQDLAAAKSALDEKKAAATDAIVRETLQKESDLITQELVRLRGEPTSEVLPAEAAKFKTDAAKKVTSDYSAALKAAKNGYLQDLLVAQKSVLAKKAGYTDTALKEAFQQEINLIGDELKRLREETRPPEKTATLPASGDQTARAATTWPLKREGDFLVLDTPHYRIKTDYPPEVAQLVAAHQEALFAELFRRMGSGRSPAQLRKLEIVLVAARKKYIEITGASGVGTQGIFTGDRICAWSPPDAVDAALETLRHECAHQFILQLIAKKCPPWLDEGLAEFYRHAQFKGGELLVGQVPLLAANAVKRALAGGRLIPVSRLLEMTENEWLASCTSDCGSAVR
jgi:hypothetical protein